MLVIGCKRGGRKGLPCYRIVVFDSKRINVRVDDLGYYQPANGQQPRSVRLDTERLQHWMNQGARVTDRVNKLVGLQSHEGKEGE